MNTDRLMVTIFQLRVKVSKCHEWLAMYTALAFFRPIFSFDEEFDAELTESDGLAWKFKLQGENQKKNKKYNLSMEIKFDAKPPSSVKFP